MPRSIPSRNFRNRFPRTRASRIGGGEGLPTAPPNPGWIHSFWADDPQWANPGDGNEVTSWRNRGTNGTAAEGSATFRESVPELNGRAAVEFNGTNEFLATGVALPEFNVDLFVVGRAIATADTTVQAWIGGGETDRYLGEGSTDVYALNNGGSQIVSTLAADTDAHSLRGLLSGFVGLGLISADNETLVIGLPGTDTWSDLVIGASTAAAGFANVQIGFIGVVQNGNLGEFATQFQDWAEAAYGVEQA